jgi:hypothetical protein
MRQSSEERWREEKRVASIKTHPEYDSTCLKRRRRRRRRGLPHCSAEDIANVRWTESEIDETGDPHEAETNLVNSQPESTSQSRPQHATSEGEEILNALYPIQPPPSRNPRPLYISFPPCSNINAPHLTPWSAHAHGSLKLSPKSRNSKALRPLLVMSLHRVTTIGPRKRSHRSGRGDHDMMGAAASI